MRELIVTKTRKPRLHVTPWSVLVFRYWLARKKSMLAMKCGAVFITSAWRNQELRQITFTHAIIALSAKLAMVDGPVRREYYLGFRDAFPLSGELCPKLRKLFDRACQDSKPVEFYVAQVKQAFPKNHALYFALAERMFAIATAHPPLSRKRERFLSRLAHQLEITPKMYALLHARYTQKRAHHILGIEKRPTRDMLRKRYHQLMQRYHPDKYANIYLTPEVAQILSQRTTEIGDAYKSLSFKVA